MDHMQYSITECFNKPFFVYITYNFGNAFHPLKQIPHTNNRKACDVIKVPIDTNH